jgi:hypothetical protein
LGAGTAELSVTNLALDDYGKIPIALGPNFQTAFDPAVVSFDVVWGGPITRSLSVTDSTHLDQFSGQYLENQATVTWSGTNLATGFSFTANPGDLSTSAPGRGFAEIGQEQNGIFFSSDSSTDSAVAPSMVPALPAQPPAIPAPAPPQITTTLPAPSPPAPVVPAAQGSVPAMSADPGGSASPIETNWAVNLSLAGF